MPQALRLVYAVAAVGLLIGGLWGGLGRLGVMTAPPAVIEAHSRWMVLGFLGGLIALERAVALPSWRSHVMPALMMIGAFAPLMGVAGAVLYVALFLIEGRRLSPGLHTWAMAAGGAVLGAAYLFLLFPHLHVQWISLLKMFLLLTIFGERLELARIIHWRQRIRPTAAFLIGAMLIAPWLPFPAEAVLMLATAGWLIYFDTARRTIRYPGLPRYIAFHLLVGYAWLAVHGMALLGGWPRDLQLHTFFLGFLWMMIFAHAPLVFPVIGGFRMPFRAMLYLPGLVMNIGLVMRWMDAPAAGALLNTAAILMLPPLMLFNARKE